MLRPFAVGLSLLCCAGLFTSLQNAGDNTTGKATNMGAGTVTVLSRASTVPIPCLRVRL